MTAMEYDPRIREAVVINESGISDEEVYEAMRVQAPEIAAISNWANSNLVVTQRNGTRRLQTIFDRDKYLNPQNYFDKFRIAADAVQHDDVVAGVTETTEQLAFKRVALEAMNEDEQSVWNQIADDLDLSQRMREIWRELFTVSQCYVAVFYGRKDYRVKGLSKNGVKKKKTFKSLLVPKAMSVLDPLKVIPVGNFLFNQEQLVYLADPSEAEDFDPLLAGANSSDLVVGQLLKGKYIPSKNERSLIQDITGVSSLDQMYLLNPKNVFRITATRPQYERFATVRMESCFELLDLKRQLRQMDRASLLGATNAIILVKKGTDQRPAKPEEIVQLATQVGGTSQRPIIVGDHRIEIEIITPKLDKTLAAERYNALDARLSARLWQVMMTGNYAAGTATDNSQGLMRVVASSMEARRDNIRDALMNKIFQPTWEANDALMDEPKMGFYPRRIALDFDPAIALYLQTLRDRGEISRETILAELDILEEDEAIKRRREAEEYDDIFTPPNNVPFDSDHMGPSAVKNAQRVAGQTGGGNNNGGGTNRQSVTNTKANPKTNSGPDSN
jgi:hypothetical protein